MAVLLPDSVQPMGNFPAVKSSDVEITLEGGTKKRLQAAYNDGDLGGGSDGIKAVTEFPSSPVNQEVVYKIEDGNDGSSAMFYQYDENNTEWIPLPPLPVYIGHNESDIQQIIFDHLELRCFLLILSGTWTDKCFLVLKNVSFNYRNDDMWIINGGLGGYVAHTFNPSQASDISVSPFEIPTGNETINVVTEESQMPIVPENAGKMYYLKNSNELWTLKSIDLYAWTYDGTTYYTENEYPNYNETVYDRNHNVVGYTIEDYQNDEVIIDGNTYERDSDKNTEAYERTYISKLESPQVTELPEPSYEIEGKIVQYIGETTNDYTKGYFYQLQDVYHEGLQWLQYNVQPDTDLSKCLEVFEDYSEPYFRKDSPSLKLGNERNGLWKKAPCINVLDDGYGINIELDDDDGVEENPYGYLTYKVFNYGRWYTGEVISFDENTKELVYTCPTLFGSQERTITMPAEPQVSYNQILLGYLTPVKYAAEVDGDFNIRGDGFIFTYGGNEDNVEFIQGHTYKSYIDRETKDLVWIDIYDVNQALSVASAASLQAIEAMNKATDIEGDIASYNSYSLNETFTGGTWIDGKKIYKKTYYMGTVPTWSSGTVFLRIPFDVDFETVVEIKGMIVPNSNSTSAQIEYYSIPKPPKVGQSSFNVSLKIKPYNNVLNLELETNSELDNKDAYATVYYTKVNN